MFFFCSSLRATAIPNTPLAFIDQWTIHGAITLFAIIRSQPNNIPATAVTITYPIPDPA